jgi:phage/plasmid-associated DNA primase
LWLSATSGNNGKGTWIALLMGLLGGSKSDGYFQTLDYGKHFDGTGMAKSNINNPDIAACEGKRFVCVNEGKDDESKNYLNTILTKRLSSQDAPIDAMGKYKDPSMWTPMMLLAFFTNSSPKISSSEAALKTRMSFLFMRFEFVENPTKPGQKPIDTSFKEAAKAGKLNAEALVWMCGFTTFLGSQTKSRQIQPRPPQVTEDTHSHFQDKTSSPKEKVEEFIKDHIVFWDRKEKPLERSEINDKFAAWCKAKYVSINPQEAFPTAGLCAAQGSTRFKVRHAGKDMPIYKMKKDGVFETVTWVAQKLTQADL